jgi:hypothetical protein
MFMHRKREEPKSVVIFVVVRTIIFFYQICNMRFVYLKIKLEDVYWFCDVLFVKKYVFKSHKVRA